MLSFVRQAAREKMPKGILLIWLCSILIDCNTQKWSIHVHTTIGRNYSLEWSIHTTISRITVCYNSDVHDRCQHDKLYYMSQLLVTILCHATVFVSVSTSTIMVQCSMFDISSSYMCKSWCSQLLFPLSKHVPKTSKRDMLYSVPHSSSRTRQWLLYI